MNDRKISGMNGSKERITEISEAEPKGIEAAFTTVEREFFEPKTNYVQNTRPEGRMENLLMYSLAAMALGAVLSGYVGYFSSSLGCSSEHYAVRRTAAEYRDSKK